MDGEIRRIHIEDLSANTFLQTSTWAKVKSEFSWDAYAFRQGKFPLLSSDVLVLVRRISFFGTLGYIPDGILYLQNDGAEVKIDALVQARAFISELHALLLDEIACKRLLSIRWDTPWLWEIEPQVIEDGSIIRMQADIISKIKTQSESNIQSTQHNTKTVIYKNRMNSLDSTQPPATVIIDLKKNVDEILSGMKSKTRYNTKLAGKKNVEITDKVTVEEFYRIYESTSSRNNISIHSIAYYQSVYEQCKNAKNIETFIYGAYAEGELIAAIFVVHNLIGEQEKEAIYLYGASSNAYRNLMPAYALQLHAIERAKEQGCSRYDMFGIPLSADPQHRMHGIYRFKIGFGGHIFSRLSSIEISTYISRGAISRCLRYRIFVLVEKLRLWYYYNYKK